MNAQELIQKNVLVEKVIKEQGLQKKPGLLSAKTL